MGYVLRHICFGGGGGNRQLSVLMLDYLFELSWVRGHCGFLGNGVATELVIPGSAWEQNKS